MQGSTGSKGEWLLQKLHLISSGTEGRLTNQELYGIPNETKQVKFWLFFL